MGVDIRDLSARQAAIEKIQVIVDPAWIYGKVLPAYVGAETDARLSAIRRVLKELDEE